MESKEYDLHTHLFTTWEKGRLSLERALRDPSYILNAIQKAELNGIALVNSADNRYEEFAYESKMFNMILGKWRVANELKNALVFEDNAGRKIRVIRGEEVETNKGHVLALGMGEGENIYPADDLEFISRRVRNCGGVLIAAHPFNIAGIGKQTLIERADLFDSFERENSNFKSLPFWELDEIERQTRLCGIAVSDSHNRKDIGVGNVLFESELDFSSEDYLKDSLKERLIKGDFKVGMKKASRLGTLAHIGLIVYDITRRKLGLL